MRVSNDYQTNAHPISGSSQPEIKWSTDRPNANTEFTALAPGSLVICKPQAGIVEYWVRGVDSQDLIGDFACVAGVLTERISVADFTDGGSTAGTLVLTADLPAGAFILGSSVMDVTGFAGDTTAVLTIGDGSDADRYNTSTFNVFSTATIPASVTTQNAPSGNRGSTAATTTVTITVTTSADFTTCKSNGAGRATIKIYYLV